MQLQSSSFTSEQPGGQHPSPLMHDTTGEPLQTPALHASPEVQATPSSQPPPWLAGAPPLHTPLLHVSPVVHVEPSSQATPSGPGTATQLSLCSLHDPMRHTSPGGAHV